MTGPARRTLKIITATLAGLALALSLNPTATAFDRDNRQAFIKAARSASAKTKLSKISNTAIVRIGTAFCDDNTGPTELNAILRANRVTLSTLQRIQIANAAYSKLCPDGYTSAKPSATPTASPTPSPAPTPSKPMLVIPENSGWTMETSQYGTKSLKAPATVGSVLPLGNAPALGISLYAGACAKAWYESAFVTFQFLDANGTPIPSEFGLTEMGLGYRPGIDNVSGCGGETEPLSNWPTAAFIKITGSTSTIPANVSLFAHNYL